MLNRSKLFFYSLPWLLALIVTATVDFKTDLSAFVIAGDNAEEAVLASEMQSGALSRRYLLSVGPDQGDAVSDSFLRDFRQRLRNIQGVTEVWVPEQTQSLSSALQKLYGHYGGALYSTDAERDLDELFTPQGLLRRAGMLKQALLSPQGRMVKSIAEQDPLLLALNGFRVLGERMQRQAEPDSPYRNLILETAASGLDVARQSRIQNAIHDIFNDLNRSRQDRLKLEMTGVPVFAVATQQLIQGDIIRVSLLSSCALMALFLLLFRSFGTLFQVFTLLAGVILSAILVTAAVFGYVHGMAVAIGSTLVGICIDYPIHAVAHAQTVPPERRRVVIAEIWPSMLLGGATTLVGYALLGASGYPGFQQVAWYAGTGIVVALLLTRFILPGLSTETVVRRLNVPWVAVWAAFGKRYRIILSVMLVLLTLASLYGLKSIRWLQDMQELTPELNDLKQNDRRIRSRMVSIEPGRLILVTGDTAETALRRTEQAYRLLDRLKQRGALSDYFGLYPWLLSAQMQRHNQAVLQRYLTATNQQLWRQALKQQGLSVERLGRLQYPSVPPLTLEQVWATPIKRLIDSRVLVGSGKTAVMIWLAEHDPEALRVTFADREGIRYFSQREVFNKMTRNYTDRAKSLFSIGLAVIIAMLIVRYKSLTSAVQTLLPAVLAALIILGLWSWSGMAVSFLHLIGLLLVVAICVDYGIFYQENRGGDCVLTYQAMAASMLTSALAFGSLAVADSATLRILAGVVALGVLLGFLFCPILIVPRQNEDRM